jgi:hypothetical protein
MYALPLPVIEYFQESICQAVNPESSHQSVYSLCEFVEMCVDGQHTLRTSPFHSIWFDLLLLAWLGFVLDMVKQGFRVLEGGKDASGAGYQQGQVSRQGMLAAVRQRKEEKAAQRKQQKQKQRGH